MYLGNRGDLCRWILGDLGLGLIPRAGVGLPRWVRGTHSGKLGKGILSEKRVNQGVEEPEWEIA